ncbi:leucyl-tRNA synthetase [Flavobacterium akiainvivens]|uniref:Leucine--tRNA ligase n=1 Tax=Flavobacterium akiainvivens TaxID=1202724 RepID=A0A0M9VII9_9FLAO|nr:class I tRNA ligase family protein [Flavobacterium akiainvivens]KOS06702.1 leucyl-tRNA synthetase [Flavobacterium akiainvivens]SFQ71044.1 leucyl-tRNA synthetase [Flavobacterium akiainvivens]
MRYNHNDIEARWQKYWAEEGTFRAEDISDKPKYYVLDMFPYPSGAGLHVGHPLGYIASDIYARYKRHQGFNVLHPQGYDSFGLPAEQYAIQTGQHPAITTEANINRYREQLDKIGFSFDWDREVRTSNPEYYKWTQWIFIQLFNSWYNKDTDKAEDISTLVAKFEANGNMGINAVSDDNIAVFSAADWNSYSPEAKALILLKYRLTYLAETEVNWCPALGTVLANDEIVNGVSERGGHPVIRKKMTQWSMRISAYAERFLTGLETIDWTESLKESQRNWIGKSVGASVKFRVMSSEEAQDDLNEGSGFGAFIQDVTGGFDDAPQNEDYIEVFTTRPDTIFGVTFMTLAPEHELVAKITTPTQKPLVDAYVEATAKRSERERMADVKTISGVFTGAYAEHPFTKEPIPVWIGDYVLAGYGTGAVMAVPAGDQRDFDFARHFGIEIKNIFDDVDITEQAYGSKDGVTLINSDFLNGDNYKEATKNAIEALEGIGQGKGKTNYRLRDAVFSRQRYWGEPFPVYYVNGLPQMIATEHLPVRLPDVEKYLPTEDGQPPLGNSAEWAWDTKQNKVVANSLIDEVSVFPLELNTMPGWAGSSWYWLRYMDPHNNDEFISKKAEAYWQNVDLYIGGSEHATGHLLYSRFWNKFLKDLGYINQEEPFKKLINQGMILGTSAFMYLLQQHTMVQDENELVKSLTSNVAKKNYVLSKNTYNDLIKGVYNPIIESVKEEILNKFRNAGINSITWFNAEPVAIPIHVDVSFVNSSDELDIEGLKNHPLYSDYKDAVFLTEDGEKFIVGREVEKMSKSKYNVVTPDDICEQYGADTLRLYEMFLGPLEQAKPWNTAGITGVSGFLKKLWKLYFDDNGLIVNANPASPEAYKILHKTIKKVQEDIENFSFNTSVSSFMIAVNELTAINCRERVILEPLAILVSPYAPHIAEELWKQLGHQGSISRVPFPIFKPEYLVESSKEYPVSFNGKTRFKLEFPLDMPVADIEAAVLADPRTTEYLNGNAPKKIIVVPGRIINVVA